MEAIRKEEEEAAALLSSAGNGPPGNVPRKKKGKNTPDDGEKIDGRAGPRSENIVLQKSREHFLHLCTVLTPAPLKAIDYIQELNATKEDLLRRLAHARGSLPPGHPLLTAQDISSPTTSQTAPLWEREWNYSPDADDEGSEDEVN